MGKPILIRPHNSSEEIKTLEMERKMLEKRKQMADVEGMQILDMWLRQIENEILSNRGENESSRLNSEESLRSVANGWEYNFYQNSRI